MSRDLRLAVLGLAGLLAMAPAAQAQVQAVYRLRLSRRRPAGHDVPDPAGRTRPGRRQRGARHRHGRDRQGGRVLPDD